MARENCLLIPTAQEEMSYDRDSLTIGCCLRPHGIHTIFVSFQNESVLPKRLHLVEFTPRAMTLPRYYACPITSDVISQG